MHLLGQLFPRTRAETLRCLFSPCVTELHLRDIARLAALSPAATQKELCYLAEQKFITARRDGNRLYYTANQKHPLYQELKSLVLKSSGVCAELRRLLEPHPDVNVALIFGSIAAGTAHAESDIDLLIIGNMGLRKLTPIIRKAAGTLEREINPICFTVEEWQKKMKKDDALFRRISNEPKIFLKGGADELSSMGK